MKAIRSILPYLKGKWNWVFLYTISNFLSVLFSTVSLVMIIPFLNMLFEKDMVLSKNPGFHFTKEGLADYFKYQLSDFIASHDHQKVYGLIFICVILITATFLKNLFLYIAKYILHPLRNGILLNIRKNLFEKITQLPIGFFTNERKGDILSRMTNDVTAVEMSIISTMELLFSTPITVIFYFVLLFVLSAKLFLFLMILLPIAGLLIGRVSKSLKKNTKFTQERLSNLLSIIEETLGGLRIIKAFSAEKNRADAFAVENEKLQQINNSIASRRELASPMSEFLGILILGIIILFGGSMALSNPPQLEPGIFIMFISSFYFLISPLKALSQIFYNLNQGKAGLERIQMILDAENNIVDKSDAKSIASFESSIEFKNVHFSYEGKMILQNINLVITKGKTIAIVGASGAGKTTLVDLIPRFHDVASGEILIDGINIKDYKIEDVRKLMGIVSQEPILFNDSIQHNIALGHDITDDQKIWDAAKVANAMEFVENKADKLLTTVGDRGTKLSGGEKQRITIARAIYKNPPILILDEATSSLDTVSERLVQDAINNLMQNRTSIVIAHRLSTVQNADEIIVLEKGEIKERGTHQALIAQQGIYKKLVEMQQVLQ
ncbi:MAG: ABC transporter ATP-binding protein [Bacteroidetes bacterium]|jgi:subfamily B ATP-binding cassette protein MsbA|nr:ABC transporter ATP-binding protein [Bacteroidota bacterium]HQW46216.1 ABC transporter ATP-binding protein [Chitinophagaceae bacterium]